MVMKMNVLWVQLVFLLMACTKGEEPSINYHTPAPSPTVSYSFATTPVWADEFDYIGKPDPEKWGYDIGGDGWGNNELQYYTDDIKNASVDNGVLTITAIKENINNNLYSSARLVSRDKGDFTYGRFEAKAKLPSGVGTWPAIWMLPTEWKYGGWPDSGEIDIMEHVGFDQGRIHITVHTETYNHTKGTQVGKNTIVPNVSTEFHTYRIDWTPEKIVGFIDDQQLFNFDNSNKGSATWPFNQKFHWLLNIAVGGNWGGMEGVDPDAFPTSMEIDYIRVYDLITTEIPTGE